MKARVFKSVSGVSQFVLALNLVAGLGLSGTAWGDNCKNPKVVIKNESGQTYQIKKFEYKDGCDDKWRSEDVKNKVVGAGESVTYTDDLEYVGNCKVPKLRLEVEVDIANDFKAGIKKTKEIEVVKQNGENPRCNTNEKLEYIIES